MDEQRQQAYQQLIQQLLSCPNGEEPTVNEADIETYLQFLLQVLRTTAESEVNPQEVYPLLAENTDKLNLTFAQLLKAWATNTLENAEPDAAKFIAGVVGNFSNLIQQFPLGNKANNMEIGITGYEIALNVYTRHT
ncbi:MAG: hypothetical protein ACKO3K_02205, partial [Cuspidothrix sp.]